MDPFLAETAERASEAARERAELILRSLAADVRAGRRTLEEALASAHRDGGRGVVSYMGELADVAERNGAPSGAVRRTRDLVAAAQGCLANLAPSRAALSAATTCAGRA